MSAVRRVLGTLLGAGACVLVVTGAYGLLWSAVWFVGDRAIVAIVRGPEGVAAVSYPGVPFGGLPPQPDSVDSGAIALTFVVSTAVVLAVGILLVASRRRRSTRQLGEGYGPRVS